MDEFVILLAVIGATLWGLWGLYYLANWLTDADDD